MERMTIKPSNPNGRPKDIDEHGNRNAKTVSELAIELIREDPMFANITKLQARKLMRKLADKMAETINPGQKIRWAGFGTFYVVAAKERLVEGMWGDQPLYVPRYHVARFKPYKKTANRLKDIPFIPRDL